MTHRERSRLPSYLYRAAGGGGSGGGGGGGGGSGSGNSGDRRRRPGMKNDKITKGKEHIHTRTSRNCVDGGVIHY